LSRPKKDLRVAYEAKKMEFIKDKIARWNEKNKVNAEVEEAKPIKMSFSEMVASVLENKKLYQINGKINSAKIMQEFNLGVDKASKIATLARNS
jgi:hypothetical protein